MTPEPRPPFHPGQVPLYPVHITAGPVVLAGDLALPPRTTGLVLFAHGSGSSRHSVRNQWVARRLQQAGCGTLLFDLLTPAEETTDAHTGHLRFDIAMLVERLQAATLWAGQEIQTRDLAVGYFGASTGGAAALVAAARLGPVVRAIVARGGRPDLAGDALRDVVSPTLLIVGERDEVVLDLNARARRLIPAEAKLVVVPGATHLFEEPGTLERVATLATAWFEQHLVPP